MRQLALPWATVNTEVTEVSKKLILGGENSKNLTTLFDGASLHNQMVKSKWRNSNFPGRAFFQSSVALLSLVMQAPVLQAQACAIEWHS